MKIINHYRKEVITYFDLLEREEAFKKRVLSAFDNNNFIVYFEFETNLELNNFINKIERQAKLLGIDIVSNVRDEFSDEQMLRRVAGLI